MIRKEKRERTKNRKEEERERQQNYTSKYIGKYIYDEKDPKKELLRRKGTKSQGEERRQGCKREEANRSTD